MRIERAVGKRLPRVTVPDFDYKARPEGTFEVPLAERIAAIRAKKAEDRARSKAKSERRMGGSGGPTRPATAKPGERSGPAGPSFRHAHNRRPRPQGRWGRPR